MDELIIRTENLCKSYTAVDYDVKGIRRFTKEGKKKIHALENLNLEIAPGELVGLIGANGAGKSTSIKLLTGILHPTSGNVFTFGRDPARFRRKNADWIGVMMGQRSQLWWDLPALDSFQLYARMYGVKKEEYQLRLEEFNRILDCESFWDRPVRQLSLGQRMRCEMIAALIHAPSLVFLDEPTIGIDILAKERILEFIGQLNRKKGMTVILTTHDIGDMGKLAEHIVILDRGRTVYDGSRESLLKFNRYERIAFSFSSPVNQEEIMKRYPGCRFENAFQAVFINDNRIASASALIGEIIAAYPVADINIIKADIESVVKQIYKDGEWKGEAE